MEGEQEVCTIEGYVWRATIHANDGDVHIELNEGPTSMSEPRVIVEIAMDAEFTSARATFLTALRENYKTDHPRARSLRCGTKYNLEIPIRLKATGLCVL